MTRPDPLCPDFNGSFERVLDKAMSLERVSEAIDQCAAGVSREELRHAALRAQSAIAASAGAEHRKYLGLLASTPHGSGSPQAVGDRTATPQEPDGQSVISMLARRVSAGTGLAFLLSGYAVRSLDDRPYVGDGLITIGVLVCAMAIGAAIGDVIWLMMESRHRPADEGDADPEVARARQAWEAALLERGMVPFLLDRVEGARVRGQSGRGTR